MTQTSDRPAPSRHRPVIVGEGCVMAVQRFRKAKAAYLAGTAQSREENEASRDPHSPGSGSPR
jgi:hypothetical protein